MKSYIAQYLAQNPRLARLGKAQLTNLTMKAMRRSRVLAEHPSFAFTELTVADNIKAVAENAAAENPATAETPATAQSAEAHQGSGVPEKEPNAQEVDAIKKSKSHLESVMGKKEEPAKPVPVPEEKPVEEEKKKAEPRGRKEWPTTRAGQQERSVSPGTLDGMAMASSSYEHEILMWPQMVPMRQHLEIEERDTPRGRSWGS
jgi:hypothetical protein